MSAQTLSTLLDAFKSVHPGRDAATLYSRVGMSKDQLANVRRWVNSPSVGEEERRVEESGGQTVNQVVEMKAVWIDARDKDAPRP